MTAAEPLADIITGEIIPTALTASEARSLTDRIRQTLHVGHDLIVEAFKGAAWSALGYDSWDAYCAGEFTGARMVRMTPGQTRELASTLRQQGLSVPAIASALGVSDRTVQRNSEQVVTPDTTSPEPVTGIDGKTYQPSAPKPVVTPASSASSNDQTKEPRQTHRRALPDHFFDATFDLIKAVERVQRLTEDDRFPRNAEQLASKNGSELLRAHEALAGVLALLAVA